MREKKIEVASRKDGCRKKDKSRGSGGNGNGFSEWFSDAAVWSYVICRMSNRKEQWRMITITSMVKYSNDYIVSFFSS
jgi:hypothetical protein